MPCTYAHREKWRDNRKSDIEAVAHTQQIQSTTCAHTLLSTVQIVFHKILFGIFMWLTWTWTEMIYVCNKKKQSTHNIMPYSSINNDEISFWFTCILQQHAHELKRRLVSIRFELFNEIWSHPLSNISNGMQTHVSQPLILNIFHNWNISSFFFFVRVHSR